MYWPLKEHKAKLKKPKASLQLAMISRSIITWLIYFSKCKRLKQQKKQNNTENFFLSLHNRANLAVMWKYEQWHGVLYFTSVSQSFHLFYCSSTEEWLEVHLFRLHITDDLSSYTYTTSWIKQQHSILTILRKNNLIERGVEVTDSKQKLQNKYHQCAICMSPNAIIALCTTLKCCMCTNPTSTTLM